MPAGWVLRTGPSTSPNVPERLPDPMTLRHDAADMGVELSDDQARKIIEFGKLLLHWNRAFNLISRKDQDRLYHRHLLDSLSLVPWMAGTRIMDLGTGAGLPGIPLAIACPHRGFTLVDRNERKIRFVRQVCRQLDVPNVEALSGDVTVVAAAASYDVVVTRAVAAAAEAWRLACAAIAPGGRLLVMASGQSEGGSLGAEALPEDARVVARERLAIPGLPQSHGLLVIERTRPLANSTELDG
jgi:16S rRNA (guanine527-N7)-methyltransferase